MRKAKEAKAKESKSKDARGKKPKREGRGRKQEFASAGTSVNSKRVPAVFKKVRWVKGTRNLDWGGGKYDTATEYMASIGCDNAIYDPYNRAPGANRITLMCAPYDTATISNVLNVIKERHIRLQTVENCLIYVADGGFAYITVYEGDRTSRGKRTKEGCWQNNRRIQAYASELAEAGYKPRIKKGMIIIKKGE